MVRATMRAAALLFGLSVGLGFATGASACEGTQCEAHGKPLDLKSFMREQAASTRTHEAVRATHSKTGHAPFRRASQTQRTTRHAVAAHRHHKTARVAAAAPPTMPPVDVTSIQEVAADQLNDIDRAAPPAPAPQPETQGFAVTEQNTPANSADMHGAVDNAFSDIDRRAAELSRAMAQVATTQAAEAVTARLEPAARSPWLQWLWSAIGASFVVAAGVARYLFA
jgi:hypothetical protein